MGEALIVRKGGEKVTIDGEKVKDKMSLRRVYSRGMFLYECPFAGSGSSAVLFNGEIHLIGAFTGGHWVLRGDSWTQVSSPPSFGEFTAATVAGDKIFVLTASDYLKSKIKCYSWNSITNSWTQIANFHDSQVFCIDVGIASIDNTVYAFAFNMFKRLDGNSWITLKSFSVGGSHHSRGLCALNGKLYALFYNTDDTYSAWIGEFNASDGTVSNEVDISVTTGDDCLGSSFTSYGDKLYVVGGTGDDWVASKRCLTCEPSNYYTTGGYSIPFSFVYGAAIVLEDGVHLFQGYRGTSDSNKEKCSDHVLINTNAYVEGLQ